MADGSVAAQGDEEPEGTSLPSIQWSEENIDLQKLDNENGLPQVVQFEDSAGAARPGVPSSLPPGLRIYANQPVLLHSRSSKKYAKARTIYHDKEGPYFEVGQTLMIPEDFHGESRSFIYLFLNESIHS